MFIVSASLTSSLLIPVNSVIFFGIGSDGLTNELNLSIILPSWILTAPISIISFITGEKPVVSISNTTTSLSRLSFLASSRLSPSISISFTT